MIGLLLDFVFKTVRLHAHVSAEDVLAVKSVRLCSHLARWESMEVKARNKARWPEGRDADTG